MIYTTTFWFINPTHWAGFLNINADLLLSFLFTYQIVHFCTAGLRITQSSRCLIENGCTLSLGEFCFQGYVFSHTVMLQAMCSYCGKRIKKKRKEKNGTQANSKRATDRSVLRCGDWKFYFFAACFWIIFLYFCLTPKKHLINCISIFHSLNRSWIKCSQTWKREYMVEFFILPCSI